MKGYRLNRPLGRRTFVKGIIVAGVSGVVASCRRQPTGDQVSGITERSTSTTDRRPLDDTVTAPPGTTSAPPVSTSDLRPWSDPGTWPSNRVPQAGDGVTIDRRVLLDVDAIVAGVVVETTGALVFDPDQSRLLQSRGNVEVRGSLVMRPTSASIRHTLRFVEVDESRFVGGGAKVLASDVGLWVAGGDIDLAGAAKRSWTRANGSIAAGTTTISVGDASGWRVGDTVVITPTTPPTKDDDKFHQGIDHCLTYDEATIVAVGGGIVTLDRPTSSAHPSVTFTDWAGTKKTYGAEVLNVSRNVIIEGSPNGKAHIAFLHAGRQVVSHVEVRHVGPRRQASGATAKTEGVTGRYGLHFHMCGDATRGSVLEGVVVHDCGGHAFVPHDSHGITLRDCVAHNVRDTAFWWDLQERDSSYNPATNDSLWERCVASKVWSDASSAEGYRIGGFYLPEGKDLSNSCIECVAVGVRSADCTMNIAMASGFHWPELGRAIWNFHDCLAHNVGGSGILTWQNDENVHLIERFTAYNAGKSGIDHGAYANFWQYRDCALYANRRAGLAVHAVTRRTSATPSTAPPLRFENMAIDGGGLTRWGIQSEGHRFAAPDVDPTTIAGCTVRGCREASYFEPALEHRSRIRVVDCQFDAPEFRLADDAAKDTLIVVDNLNGSETFTLRPWDQAGTLVPEWNARRS